jgi:hypothetical protein
MKLDQKQRNIKKRKRGLRGRNERGPSLALFDVALCEFRPERAVT